jgi:hypothetical protein
MAELHRHVLENTTDTSSGSALPQRLSVSQRVVDSLCQSGSDSDRHKDTTKLQPATSMLAMTVGMTGVTIGLPQNEVAGRSFYRPTTRVTSKDLVEKIQPSLKGCQVDFLIDTRYTMWELRRHTRDVVHVLAPVCLQVGTGGVGVQMTEGYDDARYTTVDSLESYVGSIDQNSYDVAWTTTQTMHHMLMYDYIAKLERAKSAADSSNRRPEWGTKRKLIVITDGFLRCSYTPYWAEQTPKIVTRDASRKLQELGVPACLVEVIYIAVKGPPFDVERITRVARDHNIPVTGDVVNAIYLWQ